ncbi:hypothetical protein ACLNGM_02360 [Aureimonas phyllosphaerae]
MEAFDEKPVTPWPLWLCIAIQAALLLAIGAGLLFALKLAVSAAFQLV